MKEEMKPIFSLCHTTARLPKGWRAAAQAWKDNADHPELVEHIFVVDAPEPGSVSVLATLGADFPFTGTTKFGINEERRCCVDGWNLAAKLSTGKFLINIADDFFPCPHWDTELIKVIEANGGFDKEMALDVNTGGNHGLLTFCFITRPYYERFGYLLYPEYISVYSDNEFTDVAKRNGVVVDARHLLFKHIHPLYNPEKDTDEIYEWQSRPEAWEIGRKLYQERSKVAGLSVRRKLAMCLPGQTFSLVWVSNLLNLMNFLMPRFDIAPVLGYASNVYVSRECLVQSIEQTCRPFPDYVLWMDDDNILNHIQLAMLLDDLDNNPSIDMVAAWSWIQGDFATTEARVSCGYLNNDGVCVALKHDDMMKGDRDLLPIEWTGFPAILMRYSALVKAGGGAAFRPYPTPKHPYGFYGEDSSFSKRAVEAGVRMAVDRRVRVPHLKLRDAEPLTTTVQEEVLA